MNKTQIVPIIGLVLLTGFVMVIDNIHNCSGLEGSDLVVCNTNEQTMFFTTLMLVQTILIMITLYSITNHKEVKQ